MKSIAFYAKKSFRAKKLNSVISVNEDAIEFIENKQGYYLGVKNTDIISSKMVEDLEKIGYIKHTLDVMADGGRAIDIHLTNPITARKMTGSSSGSAINVFLDVNEVALATDGGGSVLAPALSLNLYGFISPLFYASELKKYKKTSTDGITFSPSLGLISKEIFHIENILKHYFNGKVDLEIEQGVSNIDFHQSLTHFNTYPKFKLSYDNTSRQKLMEDLSSFDFENKILVTYEGPIDLFNYGDSIIGHYDISTKSLQKNGHKYYLTVINMLGLSALVVPSDNLACGYLLICKSDEKHINAMLEVGKKIKFKRSTLEETYFSLKGGFNRC